METQKETKAETNFIERREKALQRYRGEIEWYNRVKQTQRRTYQILQICAIVLSALTPVLLLLDNFPKAIQALPAALAGMATAILATFRFQENYARFGYTMELMRSELFQYETRSSRDYSPEVDDQVAFQKLVSRMEDIIIKEVTGWRQTILKKDEDSKK